MTVPVNIAGLKTINMLTARAKEWDWGTWEAEYLRDITEHITPETVLYDVGAERGDMSAFLASYTQVAVHMFEPNPVNWPNIRATFEANGLPEPWAWVGLIGAKKGPVPGSVYDGWPPASVGPIVTGLHYRYLFDESDKTPVITLDDYADVTDTEPGVITIDVEGGEFDVLQGATEVLRTCRPTVYVAVHPDLLLKWYGRTPKDVHRTMFDAGYAATLIHIDHEEHWRYDAL